MHMRSSKQHLNKWYGNEVAAAANSQFMQLDVSLFHAVNQPVGSTQQHVLAAPLWLRLAIVFEGSQDQEQ